MLEMPEWVQKLRHYLRLHFPELWCLFASSVTFDLSLEDLIQRHWDTSSLLVEGWEGGASGRVKSQLPSLGLGDIWGTTYVPSSLWKQVVASLFTTCMISDSDWLIVFHALLPLTPHWFLYENIFKYNFIYFNWRLVTLQYVSSFAMSSVQSLSRVQLFGLNELQQARPPCPSPTPRVHSDSRPSSQWWHPAISSSAIPFSSCPQSLPTSESFPMSQLFAWGGQSTGVSGLASFLPKKSQSWSP